MAKNKHNNYKGSNKNTSKNSSKNKANSSAKEGGDMRPDDIPGRSGPGGE